MRQGGSSSGGGGKAKKVRFLLGGAVALSVAFAVLMSLLAIRASQETEVLPATMSPAGKLAPGRMDGAERGRLYVPVYSSVAAGAGGTKVDLAGTLSVRNLSPSASLVVERVEYHDTGGALVRSYLDAPHSIGALGTLEVVIPEKDASGGTGAKFLIDWTGAPGVPEPLTEAVMIGLYGSHGLSFVSPGRPAPRPQ